MEKAVPRQDSLKGMVQRQCAHIADNPRMRGQAVTTQRDERRGGIDAGDIQSIRRHVTRDRVARATAEIEHARTLRKHSDETVVPRLVVPGAAGAILVPRGRVALVVSDDAVGEVVHRARLAMERTPLKRKPRLWAGVCLWCYTLRLFVACVVAVQFEPNVRIRVAAGIVAGLVVDGVGIVRRYGLLVARVARVTGIDARWRSRERFAAGRSRTTMLEGRLVD